jgi:hypothetical protein
MVIPVFCEALLSQTKEVHNRDDQDAEVHEHEIDSAGKNVSPLIVFEIKHIKVEDAKP